MPIVVEHPRVPAIISRGVHCSVPPQPEPGNSQASPFATVGSDSSKRLASDDVDAAGSFVEPPRRKIPARNIVCRLRTRELGSPSTSVLTRRHVPGTCFNRAHALHTSVLPNATVCDVAKPAITLRRFSPDGNYLLAFSFDFASVFIYRFKGTAAANEMLASKLWRGHSSTGDGDDDGEDVINEVINDVEVRGAIFDSFFELKRVFMLPADAHGHVFRDISLFTRDGRHVILFSHGFRDSGGVGGAAEAQNDPRDFENGESLPRVNLQYVRLWILHVPTGVLTDQRTFPRDKLHLASPSQGPSLYDDVLSLLSVQHQTVHLFRVRDDGKLEILETIGKFCRSADERFWEKTAPVHVDEDDDFEGGAGLFNCLKQRFLAHLFRSFRRDAGRLRHFYRIFDQLANLKMSKAQLIDDRTLLIKYSTEESLRTPARFSDTGPSLFMMYDFVSARVWEVFEQDSEHLLKLFESFCDHFRHPSSRFPSSISSSSSARRLHDHLKAIITNARFGGSSEAVKRMLLQLPSYSQSFSPSPYLDMELFSYDEKMISSSERPKTPSEGAVRFYERESGRLSFRLHAGFAASHSPANRGHTLVHARVGFFPHPSQPFLISVQRTALDYKVLNFHFRYQHPKDICPPTMKAL